MILTDFGDAPDDGFESAGVEIDAPNDDHVVGASDDAPCESDALGIAGPAHEVAGTKPEERPGVAFERGEDEFSNLSSGDRIDAVGVDEFGEVAGRASTDNCDSKFSHAETRGFEPPIPFRENLISSEAH